MLAQLQLQAKCRQLLLYKYCMNFLEMFDKEPEGYQDLSADNSRPKLGELRKTKLTLRQLNKLRRMQEVRNYEYEQKLVLIRKQYAPPAAPPGL